VGDLSRAPLARDAAISAGVGGDRMDELRLRLLEEGARGPIAAVVLTE